MPTLPIFVRLRVVAFCAGFAAMSPACCLADWPQLPSGNGTVTIQVRDEPAGPERPLAVHLRYPSRPGAKPALGNVTAGTGLMLVLHNWGGTVFEGAPNPEVLAADYDVVAIGVTYYQSGDRGIGTEPAPYDFGYLQAMDALRALHYVYTSLRTAGHEFAARRIYGCGGSGGGNVIEMANKFAPRTFACIVDLSGMGSLTDDMAYNLPGGATLNARYSRDPASPSFLAPGGRQIRDLGNPAHLAIQKQAGCTCKIVMIHGADDAACPADDKRRVADAMRAAVLDVVPHILTKDDIDGALVKNSGHSIGDRTALLQKFAGEFLTPGLPTHCELRGPCDFDRGEAVTFPTSDGEYRITYGPNGPAIRFD